MDHLSLQVARGLLKILEEGGKTKLSEVLEVFEAAWGEKRFVDYASEFSHLWKQRQQLKTLKINTHVSYTIHPNHPASMFDRAMSSDNNTIIDRTFSNAGIPS